MKPFSKQSLLNRRNVLFDTIKYYIIFPTDNPLKSTSDNLKFMFNRLLNINQIYQSCQKQKK